MTPRQRRGELTASAARYTARKLRTKPVDGSWQERAWLFYDETPEVRFAARWYSNAMSRAKLFAGRRDEEGNVVPLPTGHRATELGEIVLLTPGRRGHGRLLGVVRDLRLLRGVPCRLTTARTTWSAWSCAPTARASPLPACPACPASPTCAWRAGRAVAWRWRPGRRLPPPGGAVPEHGGP